MSDSVWELAHRDGTSIFIRHTANGPETVDMNANTSPEEEGVTFGPFLFSDYEQIKSLQGTMGGPHNLLATIPVKTFRAQQVSLDWIVDHAEVQFGPVQSDCIVLGDMLLPLSEAGAVVADDAQKGTVGTSWVEIVQEYDADTLRGFVLDILSCICDPEAVVH